MSLSTQKKQKRRRKKTLSAEEAFHKEWQRVQNLQNKNQKRHAELQKLVDTIAPRIEPLEREVATRYYLQAEKIFDFMGRRSLPIWCKEELLDWLIDNLDTLDAHPFVDHLDLATLNQKTHEIFSALEPELDAIFEEPPPRESRQGADNKTRAERKNEQHRSAPIDDMFDELFDDPELKHAENERKQAVDEDPFEDFFSEWDHFFEQEEQAEQQKSSALDRLLRSSNINKMFRKVARILHPDKEQDPAKKEKRHQQMSELLQARDEKNITGLFDLYAKHVGGAPLEELGEDLESATELLKNQAQELREQQQEWDVNSPLEAYIVYHFGEHVGKRPATLEKHLTKHNQRIGELKRVLQGVVDGMTSIRTLKPLLEERRHYREFRGFDTHF